MYSPHVGLTLGLPGRWSGPSPHYLERRPIRAFHARSAIGVATLPHDIAVEVGMVVQLT